MTIGMELDLRSEKKEERTIRFVVDGRIQRCTIVGVPSHIQFRVCHLLIFLDISVVNLFLLLMP